MISLSSGHQLGRLLSCLVSAVQSPQDTLAGPATREHFIFPATVDLGEDLQLGGRCLPRLAVLPSDGYCRLAPSCGSPSRAFFGVCGVFSQMGRGTILGSHRHEAEPRSPTF